MTIPKWADETINQICSEYQITRPDVNWRRSHRKNGEIIITQSGERIQSFRPKNMQSSGVMHTSRATGLKRIAITAGQDRRDQKLVLLHEMAHVLAPEKEHHGEEFWKIAWKLYRQFKVPINYAKSREYEYRKLSKVVYKQLNKI
jgi:hypothetical protein